MPYPQNLGLANAVDRLRQRNQMNAMQPVAPYTGSPGENPSPAGLYANSGMAGGMSNYQAQQNYSQTGYMPNRTVGGAYGLGGIPNRLGSQQVLQQASGNQYAPMGLAANSNLGGRLWGGATPDYVAGRPAWTTGPREGRSMTPEQNAQYAVAHGLYFDPKTGAMGGNPALQSGLDPQQQGIAALGMSPFGKRMTPAEAAQARAGGSPGPNQIAAQAREGQRGGIMNRVAIRQQNAQQAQENALAMQQNQMMLGLAQRNPAMAMQMAQMNQRGQLAQQQMGLQYAQLGQQGNIAGQNSMDRRYVADQGLLAQQHQGWNARYQQAIKDGHSPSDALALAGPPPTAPGGLTGQGATYSNYVRGPNGQMGSTTPDGQFVPAPPAQPTLQGGLTGPVQQSPAAAPAGQAGYKPKKPLLDAQLATVMAAHPDQRPALMRGMGVSDQADIEHYMSLLDPEHQHRQAVQAGANVGRTAANGILGPMAGWFFDRFAGMNGVR